VKKLIAITTGEYPTQGVFTLIKYLALSLNTSAEFKKKYDLEIFVFHENFFMKIKKIIYNFFLIFKNIIFFQNNRIHKFSYPSYEFVNECISLKNKILLFSSPEIYNQRKPSLILPLLSPLKYKKCKSIGYIYDLQHLDLPNLFTKKERKFRSKDFLKTIKKNEKTFINSRYVEKGVINKFKISENKLIKIPFYPYIVDEIKNIKVITKKKYAIKKNYFIICNRFWKHKNHGIAFEAFSRFLKINQNYQLVCTGDKSDTRYPEYFNDLKKKYFHLIDNGDIRILGVIPRNDQLSLLINSEAVIQPTLYEGGPGGFSSYEAIAYQKKLVLSNIPINKEIKYNKTLFFNPLSSKDLFLKLKLINSKKKVEKNNKKIIELSNYNKIKLGKSLFKVINQIINDKN